MPQTGNYLQEVRWATICFPFVEDLSSALFSYILTGLVVKTIPIVVVNLQWPKVELTGFF
jgi:hypothetical protein